MKHQLILRKDGTIEWLGDCPLPLPVGKTQRFSEIVPVVWYLRIPFRILRFIFGETGRVAEWTRGWRCEWRMTVLNGMHAGTTMTSRDRGLLIGREYEAFYQNAEFVEEGP